VTDRRSHLVGDLYRPVIAAAVTDRVVGQHFLQLSERAVAAPPAPPTVTSVPSASRPPRAQDL
jgi:hypothetical protein